MSSHLSKRAVSIILGTEKVMGSSCVSYIQHGLSAGYRKIDTAQAYQNESEIGQAIRSSPIPREDIFITTKISSGFKKNPGSMKEAVDSARASIDRLGTYVDMFLIHQPGDYKDDMAKQNRIVTWQALEGLVKEGSIKGIGVSNYTEQHILEMREYAETFPPEINQLELHPWCQQRKLVGFCTNQDIEIQAYAAVARNSHSSDAQLCALAQKYGRSTVQILIRYSLQKGWTPIVKSTNLAHSNANIEVEGFNISEYDMKLMDSWDKKMEGSILPWLINTKDQ